ncbi:carboxypeptidase-like regulatory domain-containing protein [Tepidibacter thalassicus]|uniref:NOMO second beta-sandwich domain-containing protein n=1 Tax=Tepidibacter thalassicus DSM 15285 TaxID=1123350 RepID=A0A1M5PDT3_9FIRM|nr:carboxypeptidase-like regulatory domain-containing protein [Tepidibacter thalassicus]SHG99935.1 hypothetical protein SAMN02744040_00428 [Tepidibacter thalassicus DSM 15285]
MDKYVLGQSETAKITEENREVVLNLELKKNEYADNILIYGYIKDFNENSIENVEIIFYDKFNKKIGLTYSDRDGFYIFFGAKYNTEVKIVAKKECYKIDTIHLLLCSRIIEFDIFLEKSNLSNLSLISGHLVDENNIPLKYITVYLLKSICNNKSKVCKVTKTNIYGQFVFSDIVSGKYKVLINDSKYNIYKRCIEVEQEHKIYDIDIKLKKKELCTKIIGQIRDEDGKIIKNAVVVLYRVKENKKLEPVKYTLCNKNGIYKFLNIPYGNYIIKAKL